MRTGANDLRLAEGDGEIRSRIGGAAVGFAVEPLVFEKEDGVVAANGGAQKAVGVEGVGGKHNAEAGSVGEDTFAGLRVVNGAAGEVAADGHTDDGGRAPGPVSAPAQQG